MRLLVTGGAGFIGSHHARTMLAVYGDGRNAKTREQFGYRPEVSFERGLAETDAWWKPLKQGVPA